MLRLGNLYSDNERSITIHFIKKKKKSRNLAKRNIEASGRSILAAEFASRC